MGSDNDITIPPAHHEMPNGGSAGSAVRNHVAFDFRHGTDDIHYTVPNAKIERVVLGHGGMLMSQALSVLHLGNHASGRSRSPRVDGRTIPAGYHINGRQLR